MFPKLTKPVHTSKSIIWDTTIHHILLKSTIINLPTGIINKARNIILMLSIKTLTFNIRIPTISHIIPMLSTMPNRYLQYIQ